MSVKRPRLGTSDKGFWLIIGAGWQHEDGLGMSLKLIRYSQGEVALAEG
jgi:hypothetical protein